MKFFSVSVRARSQSLPVSIALVASLVSMFACNGSPVSKQEAKVLISTHFTKQYGLGIPRAIEIDGASFFNNQEFENLLYQPRLALATGLITAYKTSVPLFGAEKTAKILTIGQMDFNDRRLDFSLTRKATEDLYWKDDNSFWFITAENDISEILQVVPRPDGKIEVLFVFTENYTPLGLEIISAAGTLGPPWTPDHSKFRGKATVRYDEFLKRAVLENLLRSSWEPEQWRPAIWATSQDGKVALQMGKV